MTRVDLSQYAGKFAEDKDAAAKLRDTVLRPNLSRGRKIQLDFTKVEGATQSFVHALISDLIRKLGTNVLDLLEFKHCSDSIRGVISIVVEYSQLNVDDEIADSRE